MPKLIIAEKGSKDEAVFELTARGLTIGRSTENQIPLSDKNASRQHARITIEGNECFIMDLESGNGTYLNGTLITPQEKTMLRHGDLINIGNHNIKFNQLDEMLASSFNEITDSDVLEVKLLKKVLRAIDKESVPSFEVLNGNFVGKKFFLSDDTEELSIGRDTTCNFPVEEYVISRKHAKIIKKWSGISIQDLNSKNGTYVNNKQVSEAVLHDGDRIALGTIVLIFRNPKEVNLDAVGERIKRDQEVKNAPPRRAPRLREDGEMDTGDLSSTAEEAFEDVSEVPEELPEDYPAPRPRKEMISLSLFEMGMIGLGILVLVFATVSFINLIAK